MTDYAGEVIKMLSPVIGSGLASSSVNIQCKKMGVTPQEITSENINEFATRIEKIIQIFAGERIASDISLKIQKLA